MLRGDAVLDKDKDFEVSFYTPPGKNEAERLQKVAKELRDRTGHLRESIAELKTLLESDPEDVEVQMMIETHQATISASEKRAIEAEELAKAILDEESLSLAALARRRREEAHKEELRKKEEEEYKKLKRLELEQERKKRQKYLREQTKEDVSMVMLHHRHDHNAAKSSELAATVILGRKLPRPPGPKDLDLSDVYEEDDMEDRMKE